MPLERCSHKRTTPEEFFERYALPDLHSDCILWIGSLDDCGYGRIFDTANDRHVKASRWVLARKLGRPILPGLLACHTCDIRACVNEDHIYEGTYKDNSDDKYARGLGNRGERQGAAKLTDDKVRAIRADPRKGVVLAREYGVSQMTVSFIRAGKTWRHLL